MPKSYSVERARVSLLSKILFLHDQRFPKYKVRAKWLFPATEARQFLIIWLKEQKKQVNQL